MPIHWKPEHPDLRLEVGPGRAFVEVRCGGERRVRVPVLHVTVTAGGHLEMDAGELAEERAERALRVQLNVLRTQLRNKLIEVEDALCCLVDTEPQRVRR